MPAGVTTGLGLGLGLGSANQLTLTRILTLTLTLTPTPTEVSKYRPEWPPNLAAEMKQYAAEVAPPDVPLPPKGTPPTRGEVEF